MTANHRHIMGRVVKQTLNLAFQYDKKGTNAPRTAQPWYEWDWCMGVAFYGIWKAHEHLKDDAHVLQMKRWIDDRIDTGIAKLCVNTCAPLTTVLRLHQLHPDPMYERTCQTFDEYILRTAPRVPSGALAHTTLRADHVTQIWVDTLFMSVIYLVRRGLHLGRPAYVEECIRQFFLHFKPLFDTQAGLFYHGYDGVENRPLGVHWGRGNAWAIVSTLDVVEAIGTEFPEKRYLCDTLNTQLAALERHQDATGLWRTVLDDADTYLETSITAGVAYGVLKGIRMGLVDTRRRAMGERALQALVSRIDNEGNVQGGSSGTPIMATPAEYNGIAVAVTPFTQGLTLMALSEAVR